MFCRNIERDSGKTLKSALEKWWGKFYTLIQNEQLYCRNWGDWSFSCHIMAKSFASFWYSLKHEKDDTRHRRSYVSQIWRDKINNHYENRIGDVTILKDHLPHSLLLFSSFLINTSILKALFPVTSFLNNPYYH